MSDIALIWDPEKQAADFVVEGNDLATDDGLQGAVTLSLFCNAPARPGDLLPDGKVARGGEGGWWADAVPPKPGDVWGSRLWLLSREKGTENILPRAEEYAREALKWMVDDLIAERIDATAEFMSEPAGWALEVTIQRPAEDPVSFRYGYAWAAEEARS